MQLLPVRLDGPMLLAPTVHADDRGFFLEAFRAGWLQELGLDLPWVQDNHSRSLRGVVRGMHFQPGMAKLVRCARGAIFDVVVDVRVSSPTFGQWEGYELNDQNHWQFYCPDGFAHGFCVLSEDADVVYKTSAYWDPATEGGFLYRDPEVGIDWPLDSVVASGKDSGAPLLSEIVADLPFRYDNEPSAGVS